MLGTLLWCAQFVQRNGGKIRIPSSSLTNHASKHESLNLPWRQWWCRVRARGWWNPWRARGGYQHHTAAGAGPWASSSRGRRGLWPPRYGCGTGPWRRLGSKQARQRSTPPRRSRAGAGGMTPAPMRTKHGRKSGCVPGSPTSGDRGAGGLPPSRSRRRRRRGRVDRDIFARSGAESPPAQKREGFIRGSRWRVHKAHHSRDLYWASSKQKPATASPPPVSDSPLPPAPLSSHAPMLLRWVAAAARRRALPATPLSRALSYGRVVDAAVQDGELRVFVVAGEVSGDSLASRLMASLKALSPVPVRFAGVGGYVFHLPFFPASGSVPRGFDVLGRRISSLLENSWFLNLYRLSRLTFDFSSQCTLVQCTPMDP